jgi:excisionase family DNA binding protein
MSTCETTITNNLLTVREAASYFSVSRQTVLKWIASGELRCIRIGNVLRFHPEQLQQFIQSNEAKRNA